MYREKIKSKIIMSADNLAHMDPSSNFRLVAHDNNDGWRSMRPSQSLLLNMHSFHSGPVVNGINGHLHENEPPTLEELESELPVVNNDQIPLSEVLSRVVQDIYAELMTLADTSALYLFTFQYPYI